MPMPPPEGEDPFTPLPGFNFHVHFIQRQPDVGPPSDAKFTPMANIKTGVTGAFSEISGLEATMEPKVIKEGGRNYGAVQRVGPVTFATVVLKRGIILQRHLWNWWALFAGADGATNGGWGGGSRADVMIALIKDGKPVLGWKLVNAMPVKFRASDLNARGTEVAIEELHLAHEGLNMAGVV
jgi:phage tail-like protein